MGRYDGEEFLIVLPDTPSERASIPLERLRAAMHSTLLEGLADEVGVIVSIGVADYRRGEEAGDTVKRADAARFAAKRLGRNRFAWSNPE